MSAVDGWWFLASLLLLGIGAICAAHIPGIAVVVDGQPYTDTTECDDSWLRELPAIPSDQER